MDVRKTLKLVGGTPPKSRISVAKFGSAIIPAIFLWRVLATVLACMLSGGVARAESHSSSEPSPQSGALRIFTAASLIDVVDDLVAAFPEPNFDPVVVPAASSTLARQIARGAPADIFLSADPQWMDWLDGRGTIDSGSRIKFAGNRLIVVALSGTDKIVGVGADILRPAAEILRTAVPGRIAVGDPDHVPVGRYARAVLTRDGLWEEIAPALVPAANARAALRLVERGAVAAGIVYRTDAMAGTVQVVAVLDQPNPPIAYVAARVRRGDEGRGELADNFLTFLTSPVAAAILCEAGFIPIAASGNSDAARCGGIR